jgi:hypothetical protein
MLDARSGSKRGRLRLVAAAVLTVVALGALGAKCIENDSLYRDEDGDWHIVGEIHNETQVQGAGMIIGGTLFDAQGNVLATAQAPACPMELTPGTFSVYDVEFFNSDNVPQPASYKLNVLAGKALPAPLPVLEATVNDLAAERSGDTVTLTGTIRVLRPYDGDFYGCAAFYDGAGKVNRQITIIGFGDIPDGDPQPLELPLPRIPNSAQSVRFWLVGPGSEPLASDYATAPSELIDID